METKPANPRFLSLDIFRGATVALMILVNNPGTWSAMYDPLQHARWHGCTPTDLVFPFFLFAVGNALAFVMSRLQTEPDLGVWLRVLRRTLLIFGIGLFLNAFPFVEWSAGSESTLKIKDLNSLRVFGVLQRIALSFGFAALLVRVFARDNNSFRVLMISGVLLLGYWWLCVSFGTPGDPFSLEGFFGTHIDRAVLGLNHLYRGEGVPFDPEGLMSTIPSIAQVLIGWWVGQSIVTNKLSLVQVQTRILVVGVYLLAIAYVWQWVFPINKKIWTSTFVLQTSGLAMLVLAILIQWLDTREISGRKGATPPKTSLLDFLSTKFAEMLRVLFEPFGKNPLFIFVLSGMVPRFLGLLRWQSNADSQEAASWTSFLPWAYKTIFSEIGSNPRLGSLLYSVALLTIYWMIATAMDKSKVYIRV